MAISLANPEGLPKAGARRQVSVAAWSRTAFALRPDQEVRAIAILD